MSVRRQSKILDFNEYFYKKIIVNIESPISFEWSARIERSEHDTLYVSIYYCFSLVEDRAKWCLTSVVDEVEEESGNDAHKLHHFRCDDALRILHTEKQKQNSLRHTRTRKHH